MKLYHSTGKEDLQNYCIPYMFNFDLPGLELNRQTQVIYWYTKIESNLDIGTF